MPIGYGAPKVGGMDEARALLDQLMGNERDVSLDERTNKKRHFSDDDVCKHYLCGLAPFSLFRNTKSDLTPEGGYNKVQCDESKAQWEALTQEERDSYGYDYELMRVLGGFVADCDRKVRRAKARIEGDERARTSKAGDSEADMQEERVVVVAKMEELNTQAEAKVQCNPSPPPSSPPSHTHVPCR
jgi:hypothetical protein